MAYSFDGNLDFSAGANSGFLSHQIDKAAFYKGFNVSHRNGALSPRPAFIHEPIEIISKDRIYDYAHILEHGKFQASIPYDVPSGKFIITIVSGIIFFISKRNFQATVIEVADGERLNQYHDRVNWCHAPGNDSDLMIFDYPNLPLIVEGLNVRRSNLARLDSRGVPLPETPVSRIGTFCQTRVFVANGFDEFAASDSNANTNTPAPITFQESLVPGAAYINQTFAMPAQKYSTKITAMSYLSSQNSLSRVQSTKYGPLLIANKDSVAVFAANLPRANWAGEGFGQIELNGLGIPGPRALRNFNADTLFIDQFGRCQSFAKAVSEENQAWNNFSLSKEISEFTSVPDYSLHEFAVVGGGNSRAYFSVKPYRTRALDLNNRTVFDYASRGIAVLELDNFSTIGQGATPSWSGIWTRVNPMEFVDFDDESFIWSKDCDGVNRLYRVDETALHDEFRGQIYPKKSRFYTRGYDHESFFMDKKEHSLAMVLSKVRGDVSIEIERKHEGDNSFTLWGTKEFSTCEAQAGLVELGEPKDKGCGLNYRRNQIRCSIEGGSWTIEGIRLKAEQEQEPDGIQSCKSLDGRTKKKEVNDLEYDSICHLKA